MSAIISTKQLLDTIESLERRMEIHGQKIDKINNIIKLYGNNKIKAIEEIKQIINKL